MTWHLIYGVYLMMINLLSWDLLHLLWSMVIAYILEPHVPLGRFHSTSIEVGYTLEFGFVDLAHST
jgi:hypothetical protein